MRKFFLTWRSRVPEISQQPVAKLALAEISQQAAGKSQMSQTPTAESSPVQISQQPVARFREIFPLSWTHYLVLLPIKDPGERSFYEIEATNEGWSVPELKRQKASALYQRLALSRDKAGIRKLAKEGQVITKPEDLFKEPLVLEFLGLEEHARYSESDLESAIITHLEKFLLELAKVEQLMALVDALEQQLAASRATGENLLSALVAELTAA